MYKLALTRADAPEQGFWLTLDAAARNFRATGISNRA